MTFCVCDHTRRVATLLLFVCSDVDVSVVYDAFTPGSYIVSEDAGQLMVCIRADVEAGGTFNQPFSVTLTTREFAFMSATGESVQCSRLVV